MLETAGLEAIKKIGERAVAGAADVSVQNEMVRQMAQTEAFRVGELSGNELKDVGALKGREKEAATDIRNVAIDVDPIEIQNAETPRDVLEKPDLPDSEHSSDRLYEKVEPKNVENAQEVVQSDFAGQDGNESKEEKVFRGGAYKDVASREGCEKHHMPADSTTDRDFRDGPAIQMETQDHRKTASCGSSREAFEYRAKQKELVAQGKEMEAFEMDVKDIQNKFGSKYDGAIAEACDYLKKMKTEG